MLDRARPDLSAEGLDGMSDSTGDWYNLNWDAQVSVNSEESSGKR